MAHSYIGRAKISIGRSEETEAHVMEALRLSPCDTTAYVWMAGASVAKLYLGADEAEEARLRRAIENNRNHLDGRRASLREARPRGRTSIGKETGRPSRPVPEP